LAANEGPRHQGEVGLRLDPPVQRDDVHRVEQLPLVLVDPLHLDVEQRSGVDLDAGQAARLRGQRLLVGALDGAELLLELLVLGVRLEVTQQLEVACPAVADPVRDRGGEQRVGGEQPAPRRDAIGDRQEALRPHLGEVGHDFAGEQLGVEAGDAVDLVAADDCEVGHPEQPVAVLVDQREASGAALVAREAHADLVEEVFVDVEDDLGVARQQLLDGADRPGLECLGQQRVVGVGATGNHQRPRLGPGQARLVDEVAHQLGDHQRRVGVVELDRDLFRETLPVVAEPAAEARRDVADRAGDQEVFLGQAEQAAGLDVVGGVEHLGDGVDPLAAGHRVQEVALREGAEVEPVGRLGTPQPQDATDRRAWPATRTSCGAEERAAGCQRAVGLVPAASDVSADRHRDPLVGPVHAPQVAALEPCVGLLMLPTLAELLAEDAVVVAQTEADRRVLQRGERLEEAGGEATEAAVAEAGVDLGVEDRGQVESELGERVVGDPPQAGGAQAVGEQPAGQVLERQVVDGLRLDAAVQGPAGDEPVDQVLANGQHQGRHQIVDRRFR
jgi:hypothetical protein